MRSRLHKKAEIPSGSMADIAFLLLIFFLVTTTIANDKGLATLLPAKPDPDNPPPEVSKNDRNIFKVQANSLNKLLVEEEPLEDLTLLKEKIKSFVLNFRSPSESDQLVYNSLPNALKSYVAKNGRQEDSSDGPESAVVSFKVDRGTKYDLYVEVLDQINRAYNEIYAERIGLTTPEAFLELDKKDPYQKAAYLQARSGIPRAISIAEPTRVGK